ncbi:MAG: hypothetical protein ABIA91_00780 [Patescibacteria group bacterium]
MDFENQEFTKKVITDLDGAKQDIEKAEKNLADIYSMPEGVNKLDKPDNENEQTNQGDGKQPETLKKIKVEKGLEETQETTEEKKQEFWQSVEKEIKKIENNLEDVEAMKEEFQEASLTLAEIQQGITEAKQAINELLKIENFDETEKEEIWKNKSLFTRYTIWEKILNGEIKIPDEKKLEAKSEEDLDLEEQRESDILEQIDQTSFLDALNKREFEVGESVKEGEKEIEINPEDEQENSLKILQHYFARNLKKARKDLVIAQEGGKKNSVEQSKENYDQAYQGFIGAILSKETFNDAEKRAKFVEKTLAYEDRIVTKEIAELEKGENGEQNKNVIRGLYEWTDKGNVFENIPWVKKWTKSFRESMEKTKSAESDNNWFVKMAANIGLGLTKNRLLINLGLAGGAFGTVFVLGATAGVAVPATLGFLAARKVFFGLTSSYGTYDGWEGVAGAISDKKLKAGTEDDKLGLFKKMKLKRQLKKAEKDGDNDLQDKIKKELELGRDLKDIKDKLKADKKNEDVKIYKKLEKMARDEEILKEKIEELQESQEKLKGHSEDLGEWKNSQGVKEMLEHRKELLDKKSEFNEFRKEKIKNEVGDISDEDLIKKLEYYEFRARQQKIKIENLQGYDVYKIYQDECKLRLGKKYRALEKEEEKAELGLYVMNFVNEQRSTAESQIEDYIENQKYIKLAQKATAVTAGALVAVGLPQIAFKGLIGAIKEGWGGLKLGDFTAGFKGAGSGLTQGWEKTMAQNKKLLELFIGGPDIITLQNDAIATALLENAGDINNTTDSLNSAIADSNYIPEVKTALQDTINNLTDSQKIILNQKIASGDSLQKILGDSLDTKNIPAKIDTVIKTIDFNSPQEIESHFRADPSKPITASEYNRMRTIANMSSSDKFSSDAQKVLNFWKTSGKLTPEQIVDFEKELSGPVSVQPENVAQKSTDSLSGTSNIEQPTQTGGEEILKKPGIKIEDAPEVKPTTDGVVETALSPKPIGATVVESYPGQFTEATIPKNKGVIYGLYQQLSKHPDKFGYDPSSGKSVSKWASEIANYEGMKKYGETWVREPGKVAYVLEGNEKTGFQIHEVDPKTEKIIGGEGMDAHEMDPIEKPIIAEEIKERLSQKRPIIEPVSSTHEYPFIEQESSIVDLENQYEAATTPAEKTQILKTFEKNLSKTGSFESVRQINNTEILNDLSKSKNEALKFIAGDTKEMLLTQGSPTERIVNFLELEKLTGQDLRIIHSTFEQFGKESMRFWDGYNPQQARLFANYITQSGEVLRKSVGGDGNYLKNAFHDFLAKSHLNKVPTSEIWHPRVENVPNGKGGFIEKFFNVKPQSHLHKATDYLIDFGDGKPPKVIQENTLQDVLNGKSNFEVPKGASAPIVEADASGSETTFADEVSQKIHSGDIKNEKQFLAFVKSTGQNPDDYKGVWGIMMDDKKDVAGVFSGNEINEPKPVKGSEVGLDNGGEEGWKKTHGKHSVKTTTTTNYPGGKGAGAIDTETKFNQSFEELDQGVGALNKFIDPNVSFEDKINSLKEVIPDNETVRLGHFDIHRKGDVFYYMTDLEAGKGVKLTPDRVNQLLDIRNKSLGLFEDGAKPEVPKPIEQSSNFNDTTPSQPVGDVGNIGGTAPIETSQGFSPQVEGKIKNLIKTGFLGGENASANLKDLATSSGLREADLRTALESLSNKNIIENIDKITSGGLANSRELMALNEVVQILDEGPKKTPEINSLSKHLEQALSKLYKKAA